MTGVQFSQLYSSGLTAELGSDDSTRLFTDARRQQVINQAQLHWCDLTECAIRQSTISCSNGVGEYNLLSSGNTYGDFLRLADQQPEYQLLSSGSDPSTRSVAGDDFPRREINWLNQNQPGWRASTGSTPFGWYERMDGGRRLIGLVPPPRIGSSETGKLIIPYVAKPSSLVNSTDVPFRFTPIYASRIVADGSTGYWRLGEASGSTAVNELGINHGTYTNIQTLGVSGGISDTNTAASFDGSSAYVQVGDIAAYEFSSAFSLECWAKSTGSSQASLISKSNAAGNGWNLALGANNAVRFWAYSSNGVAVFDALSTSVLTDNQWHHIVATWTGSTVSTAVTIYVDAVPVLTTSASTEIPDAVNTLNLRIGWRSDGPTAKFAGSLDEVAIYSKALTAAKVADHYRAGIQSIDRVDLEPYHQALVHYGAAELEKLRLNTEGQQAQMQMFQGYLARFLRAMEPKGLKVIRTARNYFQEITRRRGQDRWTSYTPYPWRNS